MATGGINVAYTQDDHRLREKDRYARAKYHLTLRWMRARLRSGQTLYNIGVGGGYFNHLAVANGLRVVGCEPDAKAFAAAVSVLPAANCELLHTGLAAFARDRAPADYVVMHDVLEHIADDVGAVSDLRKLVGPGGQVIVSVPALPFLFGQHDIELGHYRRYTKTSLRRVLEPHFHIRRMRYFGMASIPIVLYFSVIRRASYPQSAASDNIFSAAYGSICTVESYVPEPIGTAILAELEPRA